MPRFVPIKRDVKAVRPGWPHGPSKWTDVWIAERGPVLPPVVRPDARAGIAMQRRLCESMRSVYEDTAWAICPDWWLQYSLDGKSHFAGPDILCINPRTGWVCVIECKLTNTDAYRQLFLYMSLVRKLFPWPQWKVAGFLYYARDKFVHYSGPTQHLMDSSVLLDPFEWTGSGLPLVGVLPRDFVGVPIWRSNDG